MTGRYVVSKTSYLIKYSLTQNTPPRSHLKTNESERRKEYIKITNSIIMSLRTNKYKGILIRLVMQTQMQFVRSDIYFTSKKRQRFQFSKGMSRGKKLKKNLCHLLEKNLKFVLKIFVKILKSLNCSIFLPYFEIF